MSVLQQLALERCAALVNKAIETDPETKKYFSTLNGKSLCIHITKLQLSVLVSFLNDAVMLLPATLSTEASVSLTGTPSALLRFAKTQSHTKMLMNKTIRIQGDLDVLMDLKKYQETLAIDWEGLMAEYIGDFAANRLFLVAHQAKKKLLQHFGLLKKDTLDYVHYEAELLPTRDEVEHFYSDIRSLRHEIERLEKRLRKRS